VVGLAGPNGAGKSTLLGLVMGFLSPSAGTVAIDGVSPRRFVEQNGIAYVPELVALLSDANVVVFDEPTHGLDPVWTDRFRDLGGDLRRPDRCIIIASHNLNELERVADRVAILDHGALSRIANLQGDDDSPDVLHYVLEVSSDSQAVADMFEAARQLPAGTGGRGVLWAVDGDMEALNSGLRRVLEAGVVVRSFVPRRSRLESAFHEAVSR